MHEMGRGVPSKCRGAVRSTGWSLKPRESGIQTVPHSGLALRAKPPLRSVRAQMQPFSMRELRPRQGREPDCAALARGMRRSAARRTQIPQRGLGHRLTYVVLDEPQDCRGFRAGCHLVTLTGQSLAGV